MESPPVIIAKAENSALEEILSLLNTVDLPPDGVAEHINGFFVARDDTGRLVGCVGMEQYGSRGLLRSAAVTPELQRSGLGTRPSLLGHTLQPPTGLLLQRRSQIRQSRLPES